MRKSVAIMKALINGEASIEVHRQNTHIKNTWRGDRRWA